MRELEINELTHEEAACVSGGKWIIAENGEWYWVEDEKEWE